MSKFKTKKFRLLASIALLVLVQISYAKNFYIKCQSGILLIITNADDVFDAINIGSEHLEFNTDVLLYFVSNDFDEPLHTTFLAEGLFLILSNDNDLQNIIQVGTHNSPVENTFFTGTWSTSFYEYYQEGVHLNMSFHDLSESNDGDPFENIFDVSEAEIELEAAPQFLCMYGCNEVFTSQLQRSNHHRQNKNHREDYRKLRAQCDGGFKCKFCGKTIKNYRALSGHVKCTRTKNYLDFLN